MTAVRIQVRRWLLIAVSLLVVVALVASWKASDPLGAVTADIRNEAEWIRTQVASGDYPRVVPRAIWTEAIRSLHPEGVAVRRDHVVLMYGGSAIAGWHGYRIYFTDARLPTAAHDDGEELSPTRFPFIFEVFRDG